MTSKITFSVWYSFCQLDAAFGYFGDICLNSCQYPTYGKNVKTNWPCTESECIFITWCDVSTCMEPIVTIVEPKKKDWYNKRVYKERKEIKNIYIQILDFDNIYTDIRFWWNDKKKTSINNLNCSNNIY